MAFKQFKEYYCKVQDQYLEMLGYAKDFQQAVADGQLSPEQAKQASDITERLKDNYDRLTYVMFLLNSPKRDKKQSAYDRQNRNELSYLRSCKADQKEALKEDEDSLKKFREFIRDLKHKEDHGDNGRH